MACPRMCRSLFVLSHHSNHQLYFIYCVPWPWLEYSFLLRQLWRARCKHRIACTSFILGFRGTVPRKRRFASACAHKLAYCMRAVGLGIIAHFLSQHRNHRTVQDSNSLPRMYNLQVHQLCVTAQTAHHHSEWARIFISVAPAVESQV